MSETFARSFESLFEFLDTFRTDIRDGFLNVPADGEFEAGAPCVVMLAVPVFDEELPLEGEIVDVEEGGLVLRLDETTPEFERLEGLVELCGRFIEEMLETGRFKIAGRPAGTAAPTPQGAVAEDAPAAPGPAPQAAVAAAPDDGVPFGVEPAQSGEIDEGGFRDVLMGRYLDNFAGVVRVDHPLGTSTVFFERGGPVQVRDEPVVIEECLGVLLARAGRIEEADLKLSLERMNETGKLQGECLVDMGLLNFPVLVMALMKQTEMKVLRLCELDEGSFEAYPLERHVTKFVTPPLKVPGVLFKMLRKSYDEQSAGIVAKRQEPYLDQYSRVELDFPVDDLQLKKTELEFLEILQRRSYRLRQIFSVSNMGRRQTAINLMGLMDIGVLVFDSDEDQSQVIGNYRSKLDTKIRAMMDQNHFEQLELHWSARDKDVEEGYQRLKAEWTELGDGASLPADLEKMRASVLESLDIAYGAIKDKSARQSYRKETYESQQIQFSADIFFRQAEMLMLKKRWLEVINNLERAVELVPQNRRYAQALKTVRNQAHGTD